MFRNWSHRLNLFNLFKKVSIISKWRPINIFKICIWSILPHVNCNLNLSPVTGISFDFTTLSRQCWRLHDMNNEQHILVQQVIQQNKIGMIFWDRQLNFLLKSSNKKGECVNTYNTVPIKSTIFIILNCKTINNTMPLL